MDDIDHKSCIAIKFRLKWCDVGLNLFHWKTLCIFHLVNSNTAHNRFKNIPMMTQYYQNISAGFMQQVIWLLWFHHYISGMLRFIHLSKDKHTNSTQICLFLLREHAFPSTTKKNLLIINQWATSDSPVAHETSLSWRWISLWPAASQTYK